MKIKCPNINSPEYKLLLSAVQGNHNAAFQIYNLNDGNYLDYTPDGQVSELFEELVQGFKGDVVKAMRCKALAYSASFSSKINPWLNKFIEYAAKNNGTQLTLGENLPVIEFSQAEHEGFYQVNSQGEPTAQALLNFHGEISRNPDFKNTLLEKGRYIEKYGVYANEVQEILQKGIFPYFMEYLGFKPNEQGIINKKVSDAAMRKLKAKMTAFRNKWHCGIHLRLAQTSTGWLVKEVSTEHAEPAFMFDREIMVGLQPSVNKATEDHIQKIMKATPEFLAYVKTQLDNELLNLPVTGSLEHIETPPEPSYAELNEEEFDMYSNKLSSLIGKVRNAIYNLNAEIKSIRDTTSTEVIKKTAILKTLTDRQMELEKRIEHLNTDDSTSLLRVTLLELDRLNNILLNTSELTNNYLLSDVLDQIKFYEEFIEVINEELDSDSNLALSGNNASLLTTITSRMFTIQKNKKEAFRTIQKHLVLNNKQYENLFAKKTEEEIETILDQLLENYESKAGNKLDYFVGNISTFGKDTQHSKLVKIIFDENLMTNKSIVNIVTTKLKNAAKQIKNYNNAKFLQTDKDTGEITGNLIDVFSTSFRKKLGRFSELYKGEYFRKNEGARYFQKCKFINENADIIDFRRLRTVLNTQILNLNGELGQTFLEKYKAKYPYINQYTDQELDEYEANLKRKLGKAYDIYINKVIADLQTFERAEALAADDFSDEGQIALIKKSPWVFVDSQYNKYGQMLLNAKGDVNAAPLLFDDRTYIFPTINNITLIPKNEEDYDSEFNKLDNEEFELWALLRDVYTTMINPTFTEKFNEDMAFGKVPVELLELMTRTKDVNRISKWAKGEIKNMWFDTPDKKGDNVLKLYQDTTKDSITELREYLRGLSEEQLNKEAALLKINPKLERANKIKAIAQKKVMSEYSTDIMQITAVLLDYMAIQKTREETFPASTILLEQNKNATGDKSMSYKKLENFRNKIIKGEHITHHSDKDTFLGFSFLKKKDGSFRYIQTILKKLGHIPLLKEIINENSLRKLSEADAALLKYIEQIKDQDGFTDNFTFKVFNKEHKVNIVYSYNKETNTYSKGREHSAQRMPIPPEEFSSVLLKKMNDIQTKTGIDLTTGGIVNGILQTLVVKGLALNFKGGIFNRMEGKLAAYKMDATNYYWTEGNIFYADHFLTFFNVKRLGMKLLSDEDNIERFAQMQIFEKLLNATELINDRRNEVDRNQNVSQYKFEKRKELLDLMQFSVSNPEIKNQGAVILSILMDTYIFNTDGTMSVPLFDKETMTFPAHTLDTNGNLILKPEFRTSANIDNWENFNNLSSNIEDSYQEFYHKAVVAIARTQGNYSATDTTLALTNAYIKPLMLFRRWLPENFLNKFAQGGDYDPFTKKTSRAGVYRSAAKAPGTIGVLVALNGLTNFSLNPITLLANVGLLGTAIVSTVKNTLNGKSEKANIGFFEQDLALFKQIFLELLNIPGLFLNLRNKKTMKLTKKYNAFAKFENRVTSSGQTITNEDIGNFKYLAREMALKLTLVMAGLLLKALLWDDDDPEDADSYQRRVYNFVSNQGNKLLSTLFMFSNPRTLPNDIGNSAFLRYSESFVEGLHDIQTGNTDKWWENFLDVTPVPKSLYKGEIPILSAFAFWEEPTEYKAYQNTATDKYIKGKEHEAKQHLTQLRSMLATDIAKDIMDEDNNDLPEEFLALRGSTKSKKVMITQVRNLLPGKENYDSYLETTEATYELINSLHYHYPIQRMLFKQIKK